MQENRDISGKPAGSFALVRRLEREFIRRHAGKIALALVFMGAASASTALRAWLMEPVLDRIFVGRDASFLLLIAGAAVLLAAVKGFADYGESLLMTRIGLRIITDVQRKLFDRLIGADLAYFNAHSSGLLISRLTNDVTLMRSAAVNVLAGIGRDTLTVAFLVGVMFYQDWLLAAFTSIGFPLAIRPIARIGRRMRRVSANTQVEMGRLTTMLNQAFQSVRQVKAYGMEAYESRRAASLFEGVFSLIYSATRTRSRSGPIIEIVSSVAVAVVVVYGGHQVISGVRTPGAFFSFVTALLLAYQPMKSLASLNSSLQEGLAAAQRVFSVLDIKPTIRDRLGAKELQISGGEVRLDAVRFGYRPGVPAVDSVTLTVPAGKTVALVGPSGAGKSTIFNLILRFYDVESGSIAIDGQDVRDVTLASLRRATALVAQEVSLFDDTVRANIAYGRADATMAEIEAAAVAAGADSFIRELPAGYETVVGEHGIRLSGGQRQRVTIARAMLKDAPILLLDEATSSLDNASERQVQAALRMLMQGRTTIVIAHRLSTIIGADMICVLDHGRIVETGRHTQLLAQGGLYRRLYETEFAAEAEAETASAAAAGQD
jgi:subfamily B ATP-binding cassette protein MsbA